MMSGSNQTIMELDFMEEKLRRLGLGSDATVDPLKGKGKEFSEAYMEKIRTEQKDRQRLRREKEYRRYMSSDQYLKEGNLGAEGKVVQAVVDSARYALAAEKKRAEELIRKVDQKEEEKYNQTARFEKEVAIEKKKIEVLKNAAPVEAVVMPRGDVEATLSTITAPLFFVHPKAMMAISRPSEGLLPTCKPPRSSKKHHMAIELCCDVVKALINLTFLVSDNRFLLGEELTGKPVKSLDQELKVSEWSNWVQCCLYKKPLGSQEPPGERRTGACLTSCSYSPKDLYTQELERELGRAGATPENVPPTVPFSPITAATDSSNVGSPSASAEGSAPMSVEGEMTAELFSLAANFEEIQEVRVQCEVIGAVARFLQGEGRRLQKIAVDDIRRLGEEHDKESSTPVSASLQTGDFRRKSIGSVITFVDPLPASLPYTLPIREEVLPHWTHRMPFAATIVHGDELSGVRLLKEAIERQVCRDSSASLSSGLPSKGTPGGGAGTGSAEGGSSETPLSGASSPPPSGVSSGGGAKPHDKQTAVGQHGQEKMIGVVRVEDGIKTIFITPRTLLGRAQPMASKEGANKGTSRHTSGGGTKGAPHHRSLAEDDERKDYEAMTEVLSREIVKAHFHNLYVLTAGKVLPIQHNAVAPAPVDHTSGRRGKSSTNGGGSSGSKKLEELKHLPPAVEKTVEDESLHCLYLVGFPENEVFYQTLEVRLGPAIEAAEMTLALEWQRLDEQAAVQMACTLSASRTRSRSGSIVPKAKTPALSGSPGRVPNSSGRIGKGTSKNAAVEDTPSLIAQLHAKKVFPPVCILGFFVEYDIPARHRRLKEAYLPWSSSFPSSSNLSGTSVPTAPTSGPTLPSVTTTGAKSGNASPALFSLAGGTLLNTGIPYLLHPIYNPEHSTLSSPLFAPTSNNGINLNASTGSASLIGLTSFTPSLGTSTTTTRELLAARSSSEKIVLSNNLSVRNDNAGASMMALNLSSGGSAGGGMGVKKKMAAADWDMATLRRELVQRHYKMKQWKAQWMAAMSAPSMMLFRRLASGPQIQSPKEKSKKRGQKSSSGGSSLPANNNSPATSLPMSTSNNIKEGFPSNAHGIGTANANSNNIDIYSTDASYSGNQKEMFTFPTVLYFCHTDCVNDFSCEIGTSEGWGTPEGYSQEFSVPYPPSSSAPSFFMPPGKSHETESAHVVAVLLRKINGATRPPLHVMAQSHLVPYILPEPLRLNDYRHPAELCQDLVYRNNLYDQKLLLQKEVDAPRSLLGGRPLPSGAFSSSWTQRQGDSGSPLGLSSNGGFADSGGARPASPPATEEGGKEWERFLSPSACGIALPKDMYLPCSRFSHDGRSIQQRVLKNDVLRIEMSVFQAFSQHLKDLLHILANEAFPDSIWSGGRSQNKNFSHTVHYVSIDKNAAQLQERMQLVNDSCIEELHWRCALLLRYSVDVVIEATATALQNVYEWIQQSFFDLDPSKIASIHHLSTIPSCFASAAPFPVTSSFTKTPLSHTAPTVVGTTSGGSSSAIYRSNMTPKGHSSRKRSFNANHTSTAGSIESTTVPVFFPGSTKVSSTQEVVGNPPESFSLLHPSPAREVEPGVPLSLPLAPPVPRARRICEDKYRLSKERSIEFLSLLSQGEEKGLKCFWEAFRHRVLVPLQQELEEEFREHIQYFTQVQEYQHQLLLFQARKTAQESIANVSCAVSTPTKEAKNGSVSGSSSRRNSRKGGGRSEGKDTSSQKGSTNRSGSASSSGGKSSSGGRGAAAAAPPLQGFPTLPSLVVAEQTYSFPWSEKHTDPVSELHWDSYIKCIVEIVLSKQMSSPLPTANEHCGTIDSSRCPPLLPNSSRTRVQNTVTSLPPLHSTSAGGESKEPIFPSSLESTFTMEEGGEGATMLFSAEDGTRMRAPPSVSSHLSRSWLPSSSTEESLHPALRVSSSLGRILITIKEALSCANGAKRSAQKWLETMYQTALATPTNEIFPDCMRPRTISQLFSAPPLHPSPPPVHQMTPTPLSPYASHSSDSNRETGVSFFTGEPSDTYIWPRLHLELLLSHFSIYEKDELSLEEFLHCASLSQLSQAWRYMNVNLRQLSLNVGYVRECREGSLEVGSGVVRQTSSIVADEKPAQASLKKRETTTSSTSGGNCSGRSNEVEKADHNQMGIVEGYLPDVLNIACLLRSPCREEPYRTLPFLSARELVNLFHRSTMSEEESREKSSGRPPLLNIRWWLFNVICRRFCFCQDHRCEFRRTVALPLPSPRELRQAVSLLPECVLYPPSTTIHLLPPYTSRGKKEGRHVVKDQGVPLEWWSYETPRTEERTAEGRCAAAGTEHVCSKAGSLALARHRGASSVKSAAMSTLKRALTRIATSSFCVSKYGVLRQAHPNLPLVLYLLSYYPDSIEDSVSRMFHCFAALMEKSPEPECFFESGGAASLAAAKVNLTVEEFTRLFSCFLHKRHSPLFTFSSSSSFIGGLTPPLPLQTPNVPSFSPGSALCFSALDTVLLEVDAQLLLQVEEKEKISLTTLLSSHWGRSLVRSHFT